jgi:hypothetical protein
MKSYSLIIKKIFIGLSLSFALIPQAFADEVPKNATPMILAGVMNGAATQMMKIYYNAIVQMYNQALSMPADIMYEFDPQLPSTQLNNKSINDNLATLQTNLRKVSNTHVNDAFSSIKQKDDNQRSLSSVIALDDIVKFPSTSTNIYLIGGANTSDVTNAKAEQNTVFFDAESLLGYDVYDSSDKLANAQNYLLEAENIIDLPPIIQLAVPSFDVPMEDPNNPGSDMVTLGKDTPLTASDLKVMSDILQRNPIAYTYKNNYRAMIALRSLYLDVIELIYQERTPLTGGDKRSIVEIRNAEVSKRLTAGYYNDMAKASPATVSRESLFVLAQISNQLNDIQKQNQQILLMNALDGLNKLRAGSKDQADEAKEVGTLLYCSLADNKSKSVCAKSSDNSTP